MNIRKEYLFLSILGLLLIFFRFNPIPENILSWDTFGYYLYLPATFIYKDLTLQNHDWIHFIVEKYNTSATLYQIYEVETGNWLIRYTMGLSVLLLPFFFLAHIIAYVSGLPTDGFSAPYQIIVTAGAILYAITGLVYLYKILVIYFMRHIAIIVIFIIYFGTNYFHLTALDGTLITHNFLFTFYAILIYYTIKWHKQQKLNHLVLIALSAGIIILIRPPESICVLIPVLWNITGIKSIREKWLLIRINVKQIIIAAIVFVICLLPQILYWKLITGHFLIDPYQNNPGEGLDLTSPHTLNFLFSFRKGWLIYTPVIVFALAGFIFLYKYNRSIFIALFIFFVADLYVVSSWTTWWYAGGSYSARGIVPAYIALAIPLGYFIYSISGKKKIIKYSVYAVILFFISLNLFQTWQFNKGIITKETMTKEYYWAIFGKTKVNEDDKKLLLIERSAGTNEELIHEDEYSTRIIYHNLFTSYSNSRFILNEEIKFSPGIDIKYKDLTSGDHAWLRISALIEVPENFNDALPVVVATFHHKGGAYKYRGVLPDTNIQSLKNEYKVRFDYLTPEVRTKDDNLKIYVWHTGKQEVYLKELKVELFTK